jgi:hypothetical protein
MPFDPASLAISAGTSALAPVVGKALGGLFGLDELSPDEKAARANLEQLASGRVATPAQLMLQQQKADTLKNLQAMAARGTAQQQAGQTRMAMQMAPEIQQRQAAQLAAQRAQEMQQAKANLAALQQQQGSQNRQYMQHLIGAGVQGAAGAGAMAMTQNPDANAQKVDQNAAEAYNEEQAQKRAQFYKSLPSAPATASSAIAPLAAQPAVQTATSMTAAPQAQVSTGATAPMAGPAATPLALGQSGASAAKFAGGLMPHANFGEDSMQPYQLGRRRMMGGY